MLHSISTVFTYLTLLEAGVGKATNQALYKPLANDDKDQINAIMAATNKFYRRTGYIYAIAVLIFAAVYCFVVKTTLSKAIVFLVIVLSGASSVLSYFVQGKYNVLMGAEGKSYVLTNISTVSSILSSICKILLVYYIRRYYKWLNLKVKPDYKAISQRNYVLIHQIAGLVFDNTDIILLTLFTNLKVVSVYSLYTTFYTVIKSVLNTISYSYSYALGQIYHSDRERFIKLHNVYEVYNMSLTFSFMCILNIFILPFISIYTSGVTDIQYVDKYIPMLFTAVYLLSNSRASSGLIIDFAQHFEQTKWRAVLEASINITVSLVAIHYLGIYGALIGTVVALLYRANDMIIYANRLINRSPLITYKRWIINLIVFAATTYVSKLILPEMSTLLQVIIYGIAACVIIIPLFLIADSLCELKTAKYAFDLMLKMFRSRRRAD